MSVKISELPILDSLADNDVIAGVDTSANVTSKIEMATLKNYIDTNTQYTAGTNIDITNNVISAPFVYDRTQTNALLDDFKDETNASIEDLEEETNEQIEELQSEVDSLSTIFNAFPTESGEDESMTLDGTAEVKFKKFDLKGNTSQTTYSGYNLCKFSSNQNSIVTVNNDGTIRINGTSAGFSMNYNSITFESGTAYSCIYQLVSGSVNAPNGLGIMSAFGTSGYWPGSGVKETVTPSSNLTRQGMWVAEGAVFTDAVFKVLIYKGSDTKTWEPYVGSTPTNITASPNPSYPQPVNVVSGDNEISIAGKNLLDLSSFVDYTSQGVTFSKENGIIKVTGTPTATSWNRRLNITLPAGTYTFSGVDNLNANGLRLTLYYSDNDSYSISKSDSSKTFTISEEKTYGLAIWVQSTTDFPTGNVILTPMIEKGTSKTSFEPYNGNAYNVDLPVENLYEGSQDFSGTWTNANQWATDENTYNGLIVKKRMGQWQGLSKDIQVESGKTYTFSLYAKSDSARAVGIYISSGTASVTPYTKEFSTTTEWKRYSVTFTCNSSGTVKPRLENRTTGETSYTYICGYQLEKGNKLNSYTPYGTTPIELCKIGNYQDYFYKDNGKWYLHKEIGKVVLNGSENWQSVSSVVSGTSRFYYDDDNILNPAYINAPFSNMFKSLRWVDIYNQDTTTRNGVACWDDASHQGRLLIRIDNTFADSVSAFKTWLGTNLPIVYYVLATPTNEEITYQPLIDQLNLLEKAMSKDGQTNISQVNNDKPFILDVTAIKSLQNILDRIELLES